MLVSFEEPYVVTYERGARYTFADFLGICGGLLGLFLGVSALSVIEFIYYSTLRLYWKLHNTKIKHGLKSKEKNRRKIAPNGGLTFKKLEIKTIEQIRQKTF